MPKKPTKEANITCPKVMCAEFYQPLLPQVSMATIELCTCGRKRDISQIPLVSSDGLSRKEREERIEKNLNAWKQNHDEIRECLEKHKSFVQQTLRDALKRTLPTSPLPLPSLPLPSLVLPSEQPASPSLPTPSFVPPSSPLASSSPSSPPTRRTRRGSVSKKSKLPKRPTLNKRENHSPPASPTKAIINNDSTNTFNKTKETEGEKQNENITRKEDNNKENEISNNGPEPAVLHSRPRQPSPPKALAPRSNYAPVRAPSLSPRSKREPTPEFRTYSPTTPSPRSPPLLLRPADLALFVLKPPTTRFMNVKEAIVELNEYMEKLEKVGGIAALQKCGRLCEMCSATPTTVKGRLRLLFEKNFIAALPDVKKEIQQAMQHIDRVHPRDRLRGRSRSATWTTSPLANSSTRNKPAHAPIIPITVFTPTAPTSKSFTATLSPSPDLS